MGIQPLEPGYARFAIKPQPGALTHAEGGHADAARPDRRRVRHDARLRRALVKRRRRTPPASSTLPERGGRAVGCRLPPVRRDGRPPTRARFARRARLRRPERRRRRRHRPGHARRSTLGAPASFGTFTPGIAKTYDATTTANVISTAGDAALTGRRPPPRQRRVHAAAAAHRRLSKSAWTAPVSNDAGDDRASPAHRRHRRAAHRHLLSDADLHAVDDDALAPTLRLDGEHRDAAAREQRVRDAAREAMPRGRGPVTSRSKPPLSA